MLTAAFLSAASGWSRPARPAWLRATTADVTIITTLDRKEAIARANQFSQYVAALRTYFGNPPQPPAPLTMVVFDRDYDFNRYRPLRANGKPEQVGGFFVRHESWAVIGLSAEATAEAHRTIFHEGVHWFLNAADNWMPPWMDEGMAEVFSTFEIVDHDARWGRALNDHVALLRRNGLQPLRRVLFTDRGELFQDNLHRTSLFYAESWALVHFLIFGENKVPRDAAKRYTALVSGGTDPDEAFKIAFGRTYEEMDQLLKKYLNDGTYHLSRRPLAVPATVTVEPADPQEVDEALGRLALVANRYTLAADHARAMVARRDGDPRGHALLGLAYKELHQQADAVAEFEAAVKHGSTDFQPYFEAACDLQNTEVGIGGGVTDVEARQAADYYERAITLYPSLEGSYTNLAGVVGMAEPAKDADRETLESGARLFPRNLMIQLGLAQLARRGGDAAAGRQILERVCAHQPAPDGNVLGYASRIRAAWDEQDLFDRVNSLTATSKYADAIRLIDDHLRDGTDAGTRIQIVSMRRELEAALSIQNLNAALKEQDWISARKVIAGILKSDGPANAKSEAKRILGELDDRALGPTAKNE